MSHFEITLLALTVIALLWTKALNVLSTWRFVGLHGESNPIARWLFEKTDLAGGMAIVCALYILILGLQIAAVVWINDSWVPLQPTSNTMSLASTARGGTAP
jgi:hypothetical protein